MPIGIFEIALIGLILILAFTFAVIGTRHLSKTNADRNLSTRPRQLALLFITFVIAGTYVAICIQQRALIDFPMGLLGLLGISPASDVPIRPQRV